MELDPKTENVADYYKHLSLFWTDIIHLMSSKPQSLTSIGPMRAFAANSKKVATEMINLNEDLMVFNKHLAEYYAQLADTWNTAQEKVNIKVPSIPQDVEHLEAFKRIWIDIFDNDFTELFDSPKFGNNYGKLVSKELELVKHWNNMVNIILQSAKLPSKEEVDDVYREIHALKKGLSKLDIKVQKSMMQENMVQGVQEDATDIEGQAGNSQVLDNKQPPNVAPPSPSLDAGQETSDRDVGADGMLKIKATSAGSTDAGDNNNSSNNNDDDDTTTAGQIPTTHNSKPPQNSTLQEKIQEHDALAQKQKSVPRQTKKGRRRKSSTARVSGAESAAEPGRQRKRTQKSTTRQVVDGTATGTGPDTKKTVAGTKSLGRPDSNGSDAD